MKEITQLHVVRIVAMIGVFFAHLWFRIPESVPMSGVIQTLLDRSNIGVVLFNMTTGLVLSVGLFGKGRPFTLDSAKEFYRKRFLRICPHYYVSLALFAVFNAIIVFRSLGPEAWTYLPKYLVFLQNMSTGAMVNSFAAYWWLALLAQFYLTFPLIFNLFVRLGPTRALAVICLAGWTLGYGVSWLHAAFQAPATGWAVFLANLNLLCRLPDFATGMWLGWLIAGEGQGSLAAALKTRRFALFLAAVAALALAAKTFGLANNLTGFLAWNLFLGAAVFTVIGLLPFFARLGERAAVRSFSALSFAFYLAHMPAQVYVRTLLGAPQPKTLLGYLPLLAVVVAVAYVLARLVEFLVAWRERAKRAAVSAA